MAVFKKQGVYWIDYYVNGHRRQEPHWAGERLAETGHGRAAGGVTQPV
jgi:hypothetical protein